MSDETQDERDAAERLAIEAALRVAEEDGPLGGHPAYRSAWRRQAAQELVDDRMRG